MDPTVAYILVVIVVALAFDFINGFHDSANSIATVVATRVLSPGAAVIWAAFFNFIAAFVMGTAVAKTIGKGLVDPAVLDTDVILAALTGAIIWNLITWWLGLPSSSSHALMGGLGGAAIAKAGVVALIPGGWVKPVSFIFLSPLIGTSLALLALVQRDALADRLGRHGVVGVAVAGHDLTAVLVDVGGALLADVGERRVGLVVPLIGQHREQPPQPSQ